jgi:hypothetical protein
MAESVEKSNIKQSSESIKVKCVVQQCLKAKLFTKLDEKSEYVEVNLNNKINITFLNIYFILL